MPPRLEPLPREQWDDETRALVADPALNIFATLAHHPKLHEALARVRQPRARTRARSTRAIVSCSSCARVGTAARPTSGDSTSRSHARSAITDDEIERLAAGPAAAGWSIARRAPAACRRRAPRRPDAHRRHLRRARRALRRAEQLLDLVFTVGQYHLVSMALNTFGVERDDGVTGFRSQLAPEPARRFDARTRTPATRAANSRSEVTTTRDTVS